MIEDDWGRLIFYVLLLIVIGGAMLFELAGRGGQMIRQLVLWVVIFAGLAWGADWWMEQNAPRQQVLDGGRIEVPIGRGGHFHVDAALNGTTVRLMVDTGATTVALGQRDARRIGIDPDTLAYTGIAMTANGQVPTANVTIREFAIGDIVDRNVRAVVIGGDMDGSLLGMSYLRRFARVSFESDRLILER
ncbi:TIGR02281 family clan AA aspartic protease [Paracoccus sp. (in: a-proteobacteria)]|uniref:retropepsin-like aspartic protease family protein n=1 Tax=Paracoccus sp. TaxID=267 RepID=UPI0026E07A47|nr:TIGR02281 family clan AA aspartic protease [Paracoccus sp. (in: a-proteobacteria)]MDO5648061.1 TIGR02281 family clan AA aspartic protease [Paracoccus sp. (in: a-proteobacteria)]